MQSLGFVWFCRLAETGLILRDAAMQSTDSASARTDVDALLLIVETAFGNLRSPSEQRVSRQRNFFHGPSRDTKLAALRQATPSATLRVHSERGQVGCAPTTSDRLGVFVSYSHDDDQKWLGRIRVHLARLIRDGKVELWDDTRIKAGEHWREEIRAALARARVAVLLISADFYASDFIADKELPPLLEAERERGLVILGVHINYSSFDSDRTLSEYQTINPPGEPLESLATKAEQEKVFDKLRRRIEELLEPNP
jgi:TIR domain